MKKSELKQQYVDYLFNNTLLILWLTEEQNSIFIQRGEEIVLFGSIVMWAVWAQDEYSTSQKMKVQIWPLARFHIFHNRYMNNPLCFCKRGGIEGKALEKEIRKKKNCSKKICKNKLRKKNFVKKILEKKISKQKY